MSPLTPMVQVEDAPAFEPDDVEVLLVRMRAGDRQAAAEFLGRYGPRIRRRIRGQLPQAMRRLFDSQDILSTLGRRLDSFVASRRMEADCSGELWSLVFTLADRALIEKARVFRSLAAREGEDSPFAVRMLERLRRREQEQPDGAVVEIDRVMGLLEDATDRDILSLWLMGNQHQHIAGSVGLTPSAVRKRWERIRARLRTEMDEGTH